MAENSKNVIKRTIIITAIVVASYGVCILIALGISRILTAIYY